MDFCPSIFTAMRISLALREQGAVLGEEVVLDVLLRDGRAADLRVAGDARLDGTQDAADRDAVVLVERAVLGGEVCLLDGLGHLREGHRLAVAVGHGDAVELGLAVGVVDDRDLLVGEVVGLRDGDLVVGHEDADDPDDEEGEAGDRAPLEGAEHPLLPSGASPVVATAGAATAVAVTESGARSVRSPGPVAARPASL